MAKKKKQDVEKKAALQAKKEAKQEKSAQKRISKQQKKRSSAGGNSEDVDASASEPIDEVIQNYKNHESKASKIDKPTIENLETEYPLPRANATFEYALKLRYSIQNLRNVQNWNCPPDFVPNKKKISLTVLILTYNEEIHIQRCIKSVYKFAEQIIIIDSYSNDQTLKYISNLQNSVHSHNLVQLIILTQCNLCLCKLYSILQT